MRYPASLELQNTLIDQGLPVDTVADYGDHFVVTYTRELSEQEQSLADSTISNFAPTGIPPRQLIEELTEELSVPELARFLNRMLVRVKNNQTISAGYSQHLREIIAQNQSEVDAWKSLLGVE